MKKFIKSRKLGITISYANTIVNMVTGLVLSSFLLRSLGDTEYGLYQTVASFSTYLVLLEFGTGTVMTRNISVCLNQTEPDKREEAVNRNYSTVWIISLALSALILLVAFIFFINLGNIYSNTMTPEQVAYGQKILLFLFGYLIFSYLSQNVRGMLLANEEYVFFNSLSLIKLILRFVFLILFISIFQRSIIIAMVDMFLSLCLFLSAFVYGKRKYHVRISPRYFDKAVFISSIPMCVALLLQTLTNQANSNVDKFVIGVMMSVESVALYSVTQYIFTMFGTIGTIPLSMFMPEISKNMAKKLPPGEFTDTLISPCRLTAIICGSILFGFFAVGSQFIALLYGADKKSAWIYALIILVPMFLNMTNAVIINVLDIANKRLVRSLALLGTTIANIILTVWFISMWGIVGAVIATAITMIIGNVVVMNIYYKKKFGIRVLYLFKEAYKGILPFQIIAGIAAFFVAKLVPNVLLSMLTGGVVFLAISAALIILFGLNESEKSKLKKLTRRFRKKG